jgi:hypothetical protein
MLASTNGSAWYYPDGSSYLSGGTKYFTVFIPASTSTVALDTYCDDGTPGGTRQGYTYSVTAGTSTINATASCVNQQVYPGPWVRYCYILDAGSRTDVHNRAGCIHHQPCRLDPIGKTSGICIHKGRVGVLRAAGHMTLERRLRLPGERRR